MVEIIVAVALFSMLTISTVFFSMDAYRANYNSYKKLEAASYLGELSNAILISKNDSWSSIVQNTSTGAKHLTFSNNTYSISSGSSTVNGITVSFELLPVYRDASGNVAVSGTNDAHSRKLTLTATWTDNFNTTNTYTTYTYINDWSTLPWTQTTTTDFTPGTRNNTVLTTTGDGEVSLDTVVYADWCNPNLTLTASDLPGQGIANAITALPGVAYIGTGNNASGVSYAHVTVSNSSPPVTTNVGTFDGYKTNSVFGETNYAYIGTDTNSKEVVIINVSSTPFSEAGYFNAPGNGAGSAVATSGNYGYMTSGSKFYVFDLSAKTGSRAQVGSAVNLAGTGTSIVIKGKYAYVTTNSSTTQMQIIDISNPASASVVGQAQLNALGGIDVYINSAATRAYIATATSTTKNEFFIVDITTKTGTRTVISSYDTNGMNPTGVTVAPDGTGRAIIVGTGGTEQYQVININTESSLTRCGGTTIATGANGLASVVNSVGDAYSYVITGDTSSELKLIKGGPGGGNGLGMGVVPSGTFTSSIFDTTSATTTYNTIGWNATVPNLATLKYQVRTGSTTSEVSTNAWFGPDGTTATYFTTASGENIPEVAGQGNRYVQYKAYLTSGDNVYGPIVSSVTITYQK